MAMPPVLLVATGCNSSDERLIELSQQGCQRQAQQNQTIADQSRQATEAAQQFVEASGETRREMIELQRELSAADADARQELIQIQQDLVDRDAQCRQELNELQRESQVTIHTERQNIDRQREALESERGKLADKRHRAPVIAAAMMQLGLLLACLLPFVLCGYLLYVLGHTRDDDTAVTEILIEELVADRPRLLPTPGSAPTVAEEAPLPSIEHSPDPERDKQPESSAPVA